MRLTYQRQKMLAFYGKGTPFLCLLRKFFLTSYYGATPDFAKLPQKKNAAISKKDYNAS